MHAILIATAALVGLPILLHLIMKQEPKRLPFPALRFLIQKKNTNQRKMKLRHFLLLALRMLLIALFGIALFQPILPPSGLDFGVSLSSEQPVAAVIIIDTSPSMGYVSNGQTRLAEAQRRALELLDDLPANSKVAVLDPAEPALAWEPSISDARRRVESLKEPHGVAIPVTSALSSAYSLLRTVDQESEQQEPFPRLVAIFSDRTAACWDANRADDLNKAKETIPPPAVGHLFVDLGLDDPRDVGISSIEFKPQIIPQGQAITLNATLIASGPAVEATVKMKVLGATNVPEQTKLVPIPAGSSQGVAFTVPDAVLRPGIYQVELRIETPDSLMFDNVRYATFKVSEPRKILTFSDEPDESRFWQLSHEARGEFNVEVKKPNEAVSLGNYEAVVLLNVTNPTLLWPRLAEYVEAGGKLIILPGGTGQVDLNGYALRDAAAKLMPGELRKALSTDDLDDKRKNGVPWRFDDEALKHPLLAPFREWKLQGNKDLLTQPRRAFKFWEIEPTPESRVAARFDTNDDLNQCRPAVVERSVGANGGKVLLLTTRLDNPPTDPSLLWNDYWTFENSWVVVLPNLLVKYLVGDSADAILNYATGTAVPISPPRTGVSKLKIEGPGITPRDAEIAVDGKALRLGPNRTRTAGSFKLLTPTKDWSDGFSLNPVPEECQLQKVPVGAIEAICGAGSVLPVDRKVNLRDILKLKYDQPLELFPWLLILVLMLLAVEAYIANRFYRLR